MSNSRKLIKKLIPKDLFNRIEPFGHLAEAVVANSRYGFPGRKMRIIGVTGTNGKTTTVNMIYQILLKAGYKVGMMSTVALAINDKIFPRTTHVTTESSGILQKRLVEFSKAGVEWLILEVSSHALAQYRVFGLPFSIVVMTNLTGDHLDYHKTFERYRDAKVKLFKLSGRRPDSFGVVNADDPNHPYFKQQVKNSLSYGLKKGDLRAEKVKLSQAGSSYQVSFRGLEYNIQLNLPGAFNVANSLAALAVAIHLGLPKSVIEAGLAALKEVEGRMNLIELGQDYKVIVDFASTPDAFKNFFEAVRPTIAGRLIGLFGSAGRRDEAKRFEQGKIAGQYCDELIVTEEDDRDEPGQAILEAIADGARKAGKVDGQNLFLIHDREEAIKFALSRPLRKGDMVALLGKGHEKTIETASGDKPWHEIEIAKKYIRISLKAKDKNTK